MTYRCAVSIAERREYFVLRKGLSMRSKVQERRLHPRRICRGQVAVQRLSSGRRYVGELMDLSRGGVRLALELGLARDEYVKLFFPSKSDRTRPEGRMIIGHVVESKRDAGRYLVRIAFGWDAAVGEAAHPVRKDSRSSPFYRPWSANLMALVMTVWNRE